MRRYLEIFTVMGYITLYLIAVLLSVAGANMSGFEPHAPTHLLLEEFLQLILVLLIALAAFKSRIAMAISFKQVRKSVMIWLMTGFTLNFLGFIILVSLGLCKPGSVNWPGFKILYLVMLMAIVALEEEFFFRVLIAGHLSRFFDAGTTVICSSVIFTVFHFPMLHGNYIGMVNVFLGGVLMAMAFLTSRNVWLPWAFHFAWNVSEGLIFGFNISGISFDSLIRPELQGHPVLTGGTYGYEGSIIATTLLGAAVLITCYFRKKVTSVVPVL